MPRLFLLFSAFFAAVGAGDPLGTEEAPVMDDVPDTGEDAPVMDDSFDGQEPHDDFEDPDGFDDPYKDSWWFEAHEKEMGEDMAEDMPENEGGDHEFKPGPIGQMMDDFHAYTDAIRTAHEEPEKEAELLAKVKKKYPDIDWDKTAGPVDEHMPEEDEQQYEESTIDRIHGHLDHRFYHAKDKAVADELIEYLDTLAPGAAAKAAAETARIAALSEEEYAKEFPDEFPDEHMDEHMEL